MQILFSKAPDKDILHIFFILSCVFYLAMTHTSVDQRGILLQGLNVPPSTSSTCMKSPGLQ